MVMSGRAQLMWDEAVTGYDFGPDHPMDPVRLVLTRKLVDAFGLDRDVDVVAAKPAGESTLRLVHREDYVEAVKAASVDPEAADTSYGLGTMDDPAFAGMHEVSAMIAGQSVGAAEAVWRGDAVHAVNFAGGLHHAMPGVRPGSVSTTTLRWPSRGCWSWAPSGSPISMWMCITGTGCRRRSGRIRGF